MQGYFVLTGAPGSGKTTILDSLKRAGLTAVDEPARQILAEQRAIGGSGLPETEPRLFTELLLSRALHAHRSYSGQQPVIFDRGLPDVIGYAELFGIPSEPATAAARLYRYNSVVFLVPARHDIYRQDDERRMTFEEARAFGDMIAAAYRRLGYRLLSVPPGSPEQRSDFVLQSVRRHLAT